MNSGKKLCAFINEIEPDRQKMGILFEKLQMVLCSFRIILEDAARELLYKVIFQDPDRRNAVC